MTTDRQTDRQSGRQKDKPPFPAKCSARLVQMTAQFVFRTAAKFCRFVVKLGTQLCFPSSLFRKEPYLISWDRSAAWQHAAVLHGGTARRSGRSRRPEKRWKWSVRTRTFSHRTPPKRTGERRTAKQQQNSRYAATVVIAPHSAV